MSDNESKERKRLREFLNPAIKGAKVDAVLDSLATGAGYLVDQVEAVNEQLYIATASGRYLAQRLADYGLTAPPNVGLSDDIFREIGIAVINRKQVRDLIERLLFHMFGDEATNATSRSSEFEPYNLDDGDTLSIEFDGGAATTVVFTTDQFSSISSATAQEVADAITHELRKQGKTGRAFSKDDGDGAYVTLISDTLGPSSSIVVRGGRPQNILKFDRIRQTTAGVSTQWTVTQVNGGSLRFTWSAGPNPGVGKIRVDDYVNIFGTAFSAANRGTYSVTEVNGGVVGNAYFDISNPNGVPEVVVQGTVDSILFFNPFMNDISTKRRYAAAYQAQPEILEIFIPATTKVVRRERIGSAHLHEVTIYTTTTSAGLNEITDVTTPSAGGIGDGEHFLIDTPTILYYVYFDTTGGNLSDPAVVGRTGIRVDISAAVTATDVAQAVAIAVAATPSFGAATPSTAVVRICGLDVGAVADAVNIDVAGLTVSVFQQGTNASSSTVGVPNPDEGFPDTEGPYIYDLEQPFVISSTATTAPAQLDPDSGRVISVVDSSSFPDSAGLLILGYGTSHQEGPIPYLARPSSGTLLLNPSYRIRNIHPAGTDIALVAATGPVVISKDGTDFPFYITDVVAGRLYAEELINTVAATGITVIVTIVYPGSEGLGKYNTPYDERVEIWGP
jgi:hypothetical protein